MKRALLKKIVFVFVILVLAACSDKEVDPVLMQYKAEFVAGCLPTTYSQVICFCMWDELEKYYGTERLKAMNYGGPPPEFQTVIKGISRDCGMYVP